MSSVPLQPDECRVLIVDDDPTVRSIHGRAVESLGYHVEPAADGLEALAKLPLRIDLVLLDIDMPHMDGFEVARQIRANPKYAFLPIIMVTGLTGSAYYRQALEAGANDVIAKPIDLDELHLRSRWLLALKGAYDRLVVANVDLDSSVRTVRTDLRQALEEMTEAKRRVHAAHLDTIRRLTIAAEYKDELTAGHIERVGLCSAVLARNVGFAPSQVDMIRYAASMHDVGKIGIPDAVLLKPGDLDEVERAVMEKHAMIGAELLAGSDSDVIQMGAKIALSHHERWNGGGYPQGLAGEDIALEARVCAIIDHFDASTMDRPYRHALPVGHVLDVMTEYSGTLFDPKLLDAFFECLPEIHKVREDHPVA